jgi:hypothetical protein
MKPAYQQRVIDEKAALDTKLADLVKFVNDNPTFSTLPQDEQNRLGRQAEVMDEYSRILGERIAAFTA